MELAVPLVALTGLYFVNKQSKHERSVNDYEGFAGQTKNPNYLPNTDLQNRNYPNEYPIALQRAPFYHLSLIRGYFVRV